MKPLFPGVRGHPLFVAGLSLALGVVGMLALGGFGPGWDAIFLVVAGVAGFLGTRPFRRALRWLTTREPLMTIAVFLYVLAACVFAWAIGKLDWQWLLVGLAATAAAAAFAALTDAPRLYRLASLVLFGIGFAVTGALAREFNTDFALETEWLYQFVPLLLAGIAAADITGRLLDRWVFHRLLWEVLVVIGGAAAAFVFLVVLPKLEDEPERLERKPILPVSNGPTAYVGVVDGRPAILIDGTSPGGRVLHVKAESGLSWSPDGEKLAFVRGEGRESHVCTYNTVTDTDACVTSRPADYYDPAWSPEEGPDGGRLAFSIRGRSGGHDIYTAPATPSGEAPTRLTKGPTSEIDPAWSPDGSEIAFASNQTGQFDIYVMAAADGSRPVRLSQGPAFAAADTQPAWAPHGRSIAFVSETPRTDKTDIYVVDADGRGGAKNITKDSSESSVDPAWAPKGTGLTFTRMTEDDEPAVHRIFLQGVDDAESPEQLVEPGVAKPVPEAPAPSSLPAWKPLPDPDMAKPWYAGTVRKYAPLVRLHPNEIYWPMHASAFINISRLLWFGCDRRPIPKAAPPREPYLGGEPPGDRNDYRFTRRKCSKEARTYSVLERTRLADRKAAGFVLVPKGRGVRGVEPTARRAGSPGVRPRLFVSRKVPVYYEYVRNRSITYWTFYGYSATSPAGRPGEHEGDWERITVCLDSADRAIAVVYHRHRHSHPRRWSLVPKFVTHPVVYSAQGSHASYSSPGRNQGLESFDRREEGPIWATWENLRNVLKEKWYGYGGSWGRPPGPDGPSRFKVGDEGC